MLGSAPAREDTRLYALRAVDIDDLTLIRPIFRAVAPGPRELDFRERNLIFVRNFHCFAVGDQRNRAAKRIAAARLGILPISRVSVP